MAGVRILYYMPSDCIIRYAAFYAVQIRSRASFLDIWKNSGLVSAGLEARMSINDLIMLCAPVRALPVLLNYCYDLPD